MKHQLFTLFIILDIMAACHNRTKTADNSLVAAKASLVQEDNGILDKIKLPPGFRISYFARNVKDARSMTLGANGTVFVGTRDKSVYALVDENHDGVADKVYT